MSVTQIWTIFITTSMKSHVLLSYHLSIIRLDGDKKQHGVDIFYQGRAFMRIEQKICRSLRSRRADDIPLRGVVQVRQLEGQRLKIRQVELSGEKAKLDLSLQTWKADEEGKIGPHQS